MQFDNVKQALTYALGNLEHAWHREGDIIKQVSRNLDKLTTAGATHNEDGDSVETLTQVLRLRTERRSRTALAKLTIREALDAAEERCL